MNLTNRHGLPQAFVNAVKNDSYSKGASDISATALIDAPQRRHLQYKHRDEIEEDVSSRVWALLGQTVHEILERAEDEHATTEERLFVQEIHGWTISGQFDRYIPADECLQDWKLTSVGMVRRANDSWEKQLNVLAWLARENGMEVSKLQIVAIMRDWQRARSLVDNQYPQANVAVVDIPLWTFEEQDSYVRGRVALHQAVRGGESVHCTDEERWYSGDKWAVKKPTNKRARKLFDTLADAEADCKDAEVVEHRPGEYMRCEGYCEAAPFCEQFNQGE